MCAACLPLCLKRHLSLNLEANQYNMLSARTGYVSSMPFVCALLPVLLFVFFEPERNLRCGACFSHVWQCPRKQTVHANETTRQNTHNKCVCVRNGCIDGARHPCMMQSKKSNVGLDHCHQNKHRLTTQHTHTFTVVISSPSNRHRRSNQKPSTNLTEQQQLILHSPWSCPSLFLDDSARQMRAIQRLTVDDTFRLQRFLFPWLPSFRFRAGTDIVFLHRLGWQLYTPALWSFSLPLFPARGYVLFDFGPCI